MVYRATCKEKAASTGVRRGHAVIGMGTKRTKKTASYASTLVQEQLYINTQNEGDKPSEVTFNCGGLFCEVGWELYA